MLIGGKVPCKDTGVREHFPFSRGGFGVHPLFLDFFMLCGGLKKVWRSFTHEKN